MKLRRAALLPLWGLLLIQVSAADRCASGMTTNQGECCSLCLAGSGVSVPCGSSNTKCEVCKKNVTFSSKSSATEQCTPCSRCPDNMEVLIPCTRFEDAVCHCVKGYYLEIEAGHRSCLLCRTECGADEVEITMCTDISNRLCVEKRLTRVGSPTGCVHCSSCPEHMEVARTCTCTEDTVCQCPNGTFLHVEDGISRCQPCQVCQRGYGARMPCSQERDTQCEPCPEGFFSEEKSSQSPCHPCQRECDERMVVLRECTTSSDLVCMAVETRWPMPGGAAWDGYTFEKVEDFFGDDYYTTNLNGFYKCGHCNCCEYFSGKSTTFMDIKEKQTYDIRTF
ncbi:tumor necrosis factor receptor superfamily member 16-like [Lissotriton helveticus]